MERFCEMPWRAVTLSGQGDIMPCCQFRGKVANIHQDDSSDFLNLYNSNLIKKARVDFLAGQEPKACSSCWEREDQIGHSRRLWFEEKFLNDEKPKDFAPIEFVEKPNWLQMDINLSNRCNLKCRMCGVWASNQWIEDERAFAEEGNPFKRERDENRLRLKEVGLDSLKKLIPFMGSVKRIDFKGGEPMLVPHHTDFLELIIKSGIHKNLTLHYTTNGTVINQKILELFPNFKQVNIVFSIEGTDPLYGYVRGGKKYNTKDLLSNLKKFSQTPNVRLMTNVAVQAYNLGNLKTLYNFLHSLPLENYSPKESFKCIVNSPNYLSPFVWPTSFRKEVASSLKEIDEFYFFATRLEEEPFNENLFQKFLTFTHKLDRIRDEDYFKIFPELEKYTKNFSRG